MAPEHWLQENGRTLVPLYPKSIIIFFSTKNFTRHLFDVTIFFLQILSLITRKTITLKRIRFYFPCNIKDAENKKRKDGKF